MIRPNIQSNLDVFGEAIREYSKISRKDQRQALVQAARGVAARAIEYTPVPRNRVSGQSARYHRGVIEKYYRRAAKVLDPKKWGSPAIRKAIRAKDIPALTALFENIEKYRRWDIQEWDETLIRNAMNKRGQVLEQQRTLVFQSPALMASQKDAVEDTGKAKAGWLPAFDAMGGKRLPSGGGVPKYVRRHGHGQGSFEHNLLKEDDDIFVRMTNDSAWAESGDGDRIKKDAIRNASEALLRQVVYLHRRRWELTVKKMNRKAKR